MDDYLKRAMGAYFRFGGIDQPSKDESGERQHDGKDYVVLKNVNGVLAVYRITTSGQLKKLKRWPSEIEE
jgi:hypothetical protein